MLMAHSALLDVSGRCHQIGHFELLHQESQGCVHGSVRDWWEDAEGGGRDDGYPDAADCYCLNKIV